VFRFTAVSAANIPGTDPATGDAWDIAGGAPDPYVQMFAGTSAETLSPSVSDTFSPVWNFGVNVLLDQGGPDFEFHVWDDDVGAADWIVGAGGTPAQWLEVVKQFDGVLTITDQNGIEFTMAVEPQ
jgi:hypothetical protein